MSVNHQEVCHFWASARKDSAKGFNIYFEGRSLYSYGSHYLLGFRLLPATFLLNSRSYSISTSKHQTYARRATHGRTFYVDGLTDYRSELTRLADYASGDGDKARAQAAVAAMIDALAPRDDGLLAMLADVADIAPGKAARMIDKATRAKANAADKAAKADALAARKAAARYAALPFADVAEWLAAQTADLKSANEWTRREALGRIERGSKEATRQHRAASKAGLSDRTRAAIWRKVKAYRAALADHERKSGARARLASFASHKAAMRTNLARVAAMPSDVAAPGFVFGLFRAIATNAALMRNVRFMSPATSATLSAVKAWADERNEWEAAESARIANAKRAGEIAAWRAGGRGYVRFDSDHGGAAIRATGVERDGAGAIIGGTLETSHGASVPLTHAIKAFRFVKLCHERGTGWQRNGVSVRVGHYAVDSISPAGDFVAGCHRFKWAEIVSLAVALGVFDMPADDSAVTPSAHAA